MLHLSMVYALLYCIQHSFIIDLINNVVIAAHFSKDEYGDQYSYPSEYVINFYLKSIFHYLMVVSHSTPEIQILYI